VLLVRGLALLEGMADLARVPLRAEAAVTGLCPQLNSDLLNLRFRLIHLMGCLFPFSDSGSISVIMSDYVSWLLQPITAKERPQSSKGRAQPSEGRPQSDER
jgi:hypothetical protein